MRATQPAPPEAVPARWRRRFALALAALGTLFLGTCAVAWESFTTRHDRAALRLLESADPDARRLGAALAAREEAPQAVRMIARVLAQQGEPDPAVRESCVHALGRHGQLADFDIAANIVQNDPDPYVRQVAWVAAARLDPERFRGLAGQTPGGDDPWDQIGRAGAWLEIGDVRGVDELLHWAAEGDPHQRRVASLALYRGVAPLLEAVGRWPIQHTVS